MGKQIVVVGSVNLDLVCSGKRIPAPGETLRGESFQTFFGGKGANQAVAVARLGFPVTMAGKVGDDAFGSQLRKGLRASGVNVREVAVARGTASGVALIQVDGKGQNSIMVIPGANSQLLPKDLEKVLPLLRSAGMLLAQLEIPLETVQYLCDIAGRFHVPLMLDPAPAGAMPHTALRRVTFLTPNETEACTLCGIPPSRLSRATAAECARKLQAKGAANVIVKMGSRGAYAAGSDGLQKMVPSFKVPVVDSTAAGDAFNAGLAVAILRSRSLEEAVRYAAAVGAVSVTRAGAQPAMPTATEVERLLREKRPPRGKTSRTGVVKVETVDET